MLKEPCKNTGKFIFCVSKHNLYLKIHATGNYKYFDVKKVWNTVYFFGTHITQCLKTIFTKI